MAAVGLSIKTKHTPIGMLQAATRRPYICARCLTRASRRKYATGSTGSTTTPTPTPTPPTPPAPPASGAAKLTTRRLISLHGKDTPKFLQGIITNNVRPESRAGSGFFAAFLTAQGKVLNDVFVYPTLGSQFHSQTNRSEEPGYLVEVDADQATALLAHLKRHKLRSKFQLRLLDQGELNVWSTWKEQDKWTPHACISALPPSAEQNAGQGSDGVVRLVDTRAPGMGTRLLLPDISSPGNHPALSSLDEAPLSAYTIRRYLRGVAEGQAEIPRDNAFPMNTNIDIMDGIDFKKGCYVGQELTIRTHHTGVVRRRILPVLVYDALGHVPDKPRYDPTMALTLPAQDADIKAVGKRGKPGKWIAGVGNVGLAMCRVEMMTDLIVTGEPTTYTPEDQFVVNTASETDGTDQHLGIKAFVPDWIRARVRPPKVQKRVE